MLIVTSSAGPGRLFVDQFAGSDQLTPSPSPVHDTGAAMPDDAAPNNAINEISDPRTFMMFSLRLDGGPNE
jgi:hypothetical protein